MPVEGKTFVDFIPRCYMLSNKNFNGRKIPALLSFTVVGAIKIRMCHFPTFLIKKICNCVVILDQEICMT